MGLATAWIMFTTPRTLTSMTLAPAFLAGDTRRIGMRHETIGRVDAGGVDERIGNALFEYFIECRGYAGGVGHVADDGEDVIRQRGGFLKRFQRAAKDERLRACVGETFRCCLSHATATAGDDDASVAPIEVHAPRLGRIFPPCPLRLAGIPPVRRPPRFSRNTARPASLPAAEGGPASRIPPAMTILPRIVAGLALAAGAAIPAAAAPAKRPALDTAALPEPVRRPVKYFGDVHPVLAEHCVSCHGPDKQKGGLRLDSREAALAGGSSYGPAIVPGKSGESPLLLFMAHLEPDMEMPPDEERLPDNTLAVLRAWIDQGAKWPAKSGTATGGGAELGNQELFFQKATTHWAFQPVAPADAASLKQGPVAIDGFIAARLREKGLQPSPRADARTLLRRLHFDLTGLPPTPEELEAFAAAFARDADAAVAAKADELLASPHFGERWGRFWLDLARYADTQDFQAQADLRYPFAWTYRDYVVGAFNSDKPYDVFLREQLAADQLGYPDNDPRLAALGYLTVGPRFRRRTDEVINDRIDVVTRGLMGLTVACARCHDHKYDPIPTATISTRCPGSSPAARTVPICRRLPCPRVRRIQSCARSTKPARRRRSRPCRILCRISRTRPWPMSSPSRSCTSTPSSRWRSRRPPTCASSSPARR
jgi:mono/diheme cytochrome c family protein